MSAVPTEDHWRRPLQNVSNGDSQVMPASNHALFVIPRGRGDGFQASVRGHILELIDPSSYALAPTADDLFVVSVASALAWSARRFLRTRGLPDFVSVSAEWRTHEDSPSLADITLTVTVSRGAEEVNAALTAALENSLAARIRAEAVLRISFEGVNR